MTGRLRPATTYAVIVGQVLAGRREHAGIEQAEMAAKVGLSQSTWSRIERGASALSIERLAAAARVLGSSPGVLLGRTDRVVHACAIKGIRVETRRIDSPKNSKLVAVDIRAIATIVGFTA